MHQLLFRIVKILYIELPTFNPLHHSNVPILSFFGGAGRVVAAPAAYGSSQAVGQIGAAASGLYHKPQKYGI